MHVFHDVTLRRWVVPDVSKYRVAFIFKANQSTRKQRTQKWRNTGCSGKVIETGVGQPIGGGVEWAAYGEVALTGAVLAPKWQATAREVVQYRMWVRCTYVTIDWIPLKIKALRTFVASTSTHPTRHIAEDLHLPRHRSDTIRKSHSSLYILMYVVTMSLVETSGGRRSQVQAMCCYKFDSASVLVKCDTVM